jgi:hypothetical protein
MSVFYVLNDKLKELNVQQILALADCLRNERPLDRLIELETMWIRNSEEKKSLLIEDVYALQYSAGIDEVDQIDGMTMRMNL